MKKNIFLLLFATVILNYGCTNSSTNVIVDPHPAFIVSGLTNMSIMSSSTSEISFSVQYEDSTQQLVTLAMSPLPAGITMDTGWTKSGYPTYSSYIIFYDTSAVSATPGTYPMTLTATGSISGSTTYNFNIIVLPVPTCSSAVTGKYVSCTSGCTSGIYSDSIYADTGVPNKIWFTNFENTGLKAYGIIQCNSGEIQIPEQTFGGNTIDGDGRYSAHSLSFTVYTIIGGSSTPCAVSMN